MKLKKIWIFRGILIILLIALIVLLFLFMGSRTKGILIDQKSGKESSYTLEILKQKNIDNDTVATWLKKVDIESTDEEGYYSLKNTSLKGLDMYFYLPNAKEVMGDINVSNVKVIESGTAIKVLIDTDKKIKHKKDSTDLVLHIYLTDQKDKDSAKMAQLIINDKTYSCINATFKDLR